MDADAGDVIVGIDLGTTNSLVALADAAGPRVLRAPGRGALVPSVVRLDRDAAAPRGFRAVVGEDAFDRAVEFPRRTVSSVKRLMGRSLADAAGDVAFLSYGVAESGPGTVSVEAVLEDGAVVRLSPEEVSALILSEVRSRAEAALGRAVRRAVVTVPAYFDDAQRQATRDAGRIAGLDVVRIVNEPTAAALAYGLGVESAARGGAERHVGVYDLGGGTFDVSILRLTPPAEGEGTHFFEVLSTAGDTRLGGDDIDRALVSLFCAEIAGVLGVAFDPARAEPAVRRALTGFAQGVKHRLSVEAEAAVRIELGGGRAYERVVTRPQLEALASPLVERSLEACARAVRLAERKAGGPVPLDAVVLVGGSTRMPLVRARVEAFFGMEAYTALDPDLVVALGAAVQGAVIGGGRRDALLVDVIPLSLGIETAGGAVAKIITAGSSVPARATEMFSTSVDGQTSIRLRVLQGEREMAEDCRDLGTFHLSGVPPMPAGVPQVEVAFVVDASGVLRVSAAERRSGKRATLQVVPNHGLTRERVEQIEAEGLAHAREDMRRHRVVDLVANAKLDLKWIGERLDRFRAGLDAAYTADLDAKIAALRAMVSAADADWRSADPDALHRAKEALDLASVRLQEVGIAASLRGG